MTQEKLARILGKTYLHTVTAYRPVLQGEWEQLCEKAPCALSRAAHVSAPAPAAVGAPLPESEDCYSLFTRPELAFQLGDRLEISDGTRVYQGRASDSFSYPSHTVTVVEIREVAKEIRA